jgi:hypothetical protein
VTAAPTADPLDVVEAAEPPKKALSTSRRPRKLQTSKRARPESLWIVIAPIGAARHRGPANVAAEMVDLPVAIATITSARPALIPAGPNRIGVSHAENPLHLREANVVLAKEVAGAIPVATPADVMQGALRGIAVTNPAVTNPAVTNPAVTNPAVKAPAEMSRTVKASAEMSQTVKAPAEMSRTAKNLHAMRPDARIRVVAADATTINRGSEMLMVPTGIAGPQIAGPQNVAQAMIAAIGLGDRAIAIAIQDRNRRIATQVHA